MCGVCTYITTDVPVYTCACVHMYINIHTYTYIHLYVHICIRVNAHTEVYIDIHTCVHVSMYVYICIHTYCTHIPGRSCTCNPVVPKGLMTLIPHKRPEIISDCPPPRYLVQSWKTSRGPGWAIEPHHSKLGSKDLESQWLIIMGYFKTIMV